MMPRTGRRRAPASGGASPGARGRRARSPLGGLLLLCVSATLQVHVGRAGAPEFLRGTGAGFLDDVSQSCDIDAVQDANVRQLHPILEDLANTTFFRLFRVKLKNPSCPFWQTGEKDKDHGGSCGASAGSDSFFGKKSFGGAMSFGAPPEDQPCSIDAEAANGQQESDRLDRTITGPEREAQQVRKQEKGDSCEFEEDLPTYFADLCYGDSSAQDAEDVNLIKNPERNTGYNGSHIWQAIFQENCFELGSALPRGRFGAVPGMCYEERVLYRLLSGWHASTTISIAKNFYAPGTKQKGSWAPNPKRYMDSLGKHPDRSKNLHFSFVVMLRAIKKASHFLRLWQYSTGDVLEDQRTASLVGRLLDSQVLTVCSPLFDAFDETRLFQHTSAEQRSSLKRQFKSVFTNITSLVDCVNCQRCRLHAKLYTLGLGSALKILLTPPELIAQSTSRDEIVALVNTLWKLSESMEDARILSELALAETQEPKPQRPLATPPDQAIPAAVPSPRRATGTALNDLLAPSPPSLEVVLDPSTRGALVDSALGAMRRAAASGVITAEGEMQVLRSLVVRRPSDEVLLLAKHYAADRPGLFATIAVEAAAAAFSVPAGGVIAAPAAPAPLGSAQNPADAIVIGGGLAGMVATMSLIDRGAKVIMIEKQAYLGGNSGKASSGINAALETSVESLIADTTKSAGALARPELIHRLANDSASAVDWLRHRIAVDLSMRSQLGGHTVKRTLRPSNAFVGAEITFAAGQLLTKWASERPEHFRLLLKSKWTGLEPGGAGWLAKVVANNTELAVEAYATVIASGGFGHDAKEAESLLLKNRPDLDGFPTTLGPQTTGDGVKIARDLGARLVDMDRVQLHPTGFVDPLKPQEHTKTLAAELLRGVGGLLLDRHGRRFTDELNTRQAVVNAELKATEAGVGLSAPMPERAFALVLNGKAAAMADRHVTLYTKKGLLKKVSKFAGVAEHLGAIVSDVRETYDAYNKAAKVGRDSFNRTVFPAGHWPIEETEDFYVGIVVPVIHYTMGGIGIDADGRVLAEKDGAVIPGLYAIGEASGGVHGDNRLGGNSLLECTVYGRHVGLNLPIRTVAAGVPADLVARGPSSAQTSPSASGSAAPKELREITAKELAEHVTREQRTWVGLYGDVYDLTEYIDEHPGGAEAITAVAGIDGTEHFAAVHNRELLDSMGFEPIGKLVD